MPTRALAARESMKARVHTVASRPTRGEKVMGDQLQTNLGNQAVLRFLEAQPLVGDSLQRKPLVSTPGDAYEQEADRVAKQVVAGGGHAAHEGCACGGTCPDCKKRAARRVQRRGMNAPDSGARVSKPSLHNERRSQRALAASLGAGQPLPDALRGYYEPRFGQDFGNVRLHTGAEAAALSQAFHAKAFAYGSDIFFNQGHFRPGTSEGRFLLAHELAHTIQQGASVSRQVQRREVCEADGVCRSEPDEELDYTPAVAPAVAVSAAVPLAPPGDCSFAEHRALQNEVDRACDRPRRCTQNDSCASIQERIEHNAECIRARATINARCFRGGDIGHTGALAAAVAALGNCWLVYDRRCRERPREVPVSVPVPVPAPERRFQPVIDQSFMERMSVLTGLTGTALVLYLIVSEGSRLFPPRNLIPVP